MHSENLLQKREVLSLELIISGSGSRLNFPNLNFLVCAVACMHAGGADACVCLCACASVWLSGHVVMSALAA